MEHDTTESLLSPLPEPEPPSGEILDESPGPHFDPTMDFAWIEFQKGPVLHQSIPSCVGPRAHPHAMTRLQFLLTSLASFLAALIPWGRKPKLTREDFMVEVLEVQESVENPRQFRFKAMVRDTRNHKYRAVQTLPFDMLDLRAAVERRQEIDFAVDCIVRQRIQAQA